jgi:hypothetical protein
MRQAMADVNIGARMKAARDLAGIPSIEALIEKLQERGVTKMGRTTLYAIEGNRRTSPTSASELEDIAQACGLPLAWFTADFSRLAEISEDPRQVIAQGITAALERSRERRADTSEESPPHRAGGAEQ